MKRPTQSTVPEQLHANVAESTGYRFHATSLLNNTLGAKAGGGHPPHRRSSGMWRRMVLLPLRVSGTALLAMAIAGAIWSVFAAASEDERKLFEHPVAIKTIPAKPTKDGVRNGGDPVGEIHCTYYPDFMIQETGVDSPAPDVPNLIRGAHPICSAWDVGGEISLKAEGRLVGKIERFLVFEAYENGDGIITVINANSGLTIYKDGLAYYGDGVHFGGGISAVAVENGSLHMKFTRGFHAQCSILQNGAKCWGQLAAAGKIPRAIAQTPPPVRTCAAAYSRAKIGSDDPSDIYYDVDIVLDQSGKTEVLSRGEVGCMPMQ